jgi:hypothetical protein
MQRDTGGPQRPTQHKGRQVFTASEVGEYEYCPLAWWYARYEPHVDIDTEDLFAELVEMEHAHGSQAPALPEYQFIEQLLLQRGAFEEGRQQHSEHAQQVAAMSDLEEITEERQEERAVAGPFAQIRTIIIILVVLTILCIGMALVFASR